MRGGREFQKETATTLIHREPLRDLAWSFFQGWNFYDINGWSINLFWPEINNKEIDLLPDLGHFWTVRAVAYLEPLATHTSHLEWLTPLITIATHRVGSKFTYIQIYHTKKHTPTPWLMLLLVLGKSHVKQNSC